MNRLIKICRQKEVEVEVEDLKLMVGEVNGYIKMIKILKKALDKN